MSKPKLTNKQKRFVEEYIIDFNATRAAKAAGYSASTAYASGAENLKKPQIKEAIAKAIKPISDKAKITVEFVQEELYKTYQSTVKNDNDAARLKALDLMTKILGMQQTTTKHEHDGSVQLVWDTGVPDGTS